MEPLIFPYDVIVQFLYLSDKKRHQEGPNDFPKGTQKLKQNLYPSLYGLITAAMLDCLMDWNKYGTRTIHLRALSHTYDLTQLKHSIIDPPLTLNSNMAFMFREARTFLTEP